MVADASRMDAVFVVPEGGVASEEEFEQFPVPMVSDGGGFFRFARPVVSAGGLPDPTQPDELFVDRNYADDAGIEIGDRMRVAHRARRPAHRVLHQRRRRVDRRVHGLTGLRRPDHDDRRRHRHGPGLAGRRRGVRATGDLRHAGVHGRGADPVAPYWGAFVRLTDPSELEEFRTAVDALVPDELVVYQTLEATRPKLERAISPGAVTLLVFGLVAAGLGLLLIGQAISRRLQLDALDSEVLAALGTTRRERFAAALSASPPSPRRAPSPAGWSPGCSRRPPRPVRGAGSSRTPGSMSTPSSSGSAWRSRSYSSWPWRRRSPGATPG